MNSWVRFRLGCELDLKSAPWIDCVEWNGQGLLPAAECRVQSAERGPNTTSETAGASCPSKDLGLGERADVCPGATQHLKWDHVRADVPAREVGMVRQPRDV